MEGLIKCMSWIPVMVDCSPAKLITHRESSHQQRSLRAVITCQCAWRQWIARRKLRMLKLAAREKATLKETMDKLKKKVEELESQLQLERRLRNDLEVEKTLKIRPLQEALHQLQYEIKIADDMLDRDIEKIGLLNVEIENLKEMLLLEKLSTIAALQTYAELEGMITELVLQEKNLASGAVQVHMELQQKNCDLVKQLHNAEERVQELKDSVQSLEERLLSLETEKYRLRCGSSQVKKTSDFHHIIQKISTNIEAQEDEGLLCYWLSNSTMLLLLLQCTLKATEATNNELQRQRNSVPFIGKLFSGLHFSTENSDHSFSNNRTSGRSCEMHQADDEYPASVFKEKLTDFIEKIYAKIKDNIKSELYPLLQQCAQAQKPSLESLMEGATPTHWQKIVNILHNYLATMRANYVPPFLVRKIFGQIFSFINTQMFKSVLSQACTPADIDFLKEGLLELENWCTNATQMYASGVMEELKHLRKAVGYLEPNMQQSSGTSSGSGKDKEVTYRRTKSWDISATKKTMKKEVIDSEGRRQSFLPDDDDDIRMPFSVDDIISYYSRT